MNHIREFWCGESIWQGPVWPYRGLLQQQFFLTSFWHHSETTNGRNVDVFWKGILTVKANGRMGILTQKHFLNQKFLSGLVSSVRRALASKLRNPAFKSRSSTVGIIIMWGARQVWKLGWAKSCKQGAFHFFISFHSCGHPGGGVQESY